MEQQRTLILSLTALVVGAVLTLAIAPAAHADGDTAITITEVETSRYPEVSIYVASPSGETPPESAEGIVLEERVASQLARQTVSSASIVERGVSVMVLVDLHRRMRGVGMPDPSDPEAAPLSRLDTARVAISRLAAALTQRSPALNRIGIIGYHRDLLTVLPLQSVNAAAVDRAVRADSPDLRLPPIYPRAPRDPADSADPADPYNRSALSLAVGAALDTLATEPAGRQQVLVIIGSTCDDLSPDFKERDDLPCTEDPAVAAHIANYRSERALSIYGVGVGSNTKDNPVEPPTRVDRGFNYTANHSQIALLAKATPGTFFQLHTPQATQATAVWDSFSQTVIAPIARRSAQLRITYQSSPPDTLDQVNRVVWVRLGDAEPTTMDYRAPLLELLVNGTPVTSAGATALESAQIGARLVDGSREITAAERQLTIPTPVITPTVIDFTPTRAIETNRWALVFALGALGLMIAAFCAWLLYPLLFARGFRSLTSSQAATTQANLDKLRNDPNQNLPLWSYVLEQIEGPEPGKREYLTQFPTVIGTDVHQCTIVLKDYNYIGPQHVRIFQNPHAAVPTTPDLLVQDLEQENGIAVDNTRVAPGATMTLPDGGILTVGRVRYLLRIGSKPGPVLSGHTQRLTPTPDTAAVNS